MMKTMCWTAGRAPMSWTAAGSPPAASATAPATGTPPAASRSAWETGGTAGEAEGDTLINIENLIGSRFDDTLSGDNGDNILLGGRGDDTLAGGGGADLLLGGEGNDTASYQRNFSNHGVRVDLALGTADGATAEGDRLADIENLIGSTQADKLYGTDESNRLWGWRGDDLLTGRGGADVFVFHSTDGHDMVADFDPNQDRLELHLYYDQAFDWQTLDIQADGEDTVIRIDADNSLRLSGVAPDELGEDHFTFVRIARPARTDTADTPAPTGPGLTLVGGAGDDELTGGPHNDKLNGNEGDDILNGGPGDDELTGGPGEDELDGGEGIDAALYRNSPAGIQIDLTVFNSPSNPGYGGDAEGDRLRNIEDLHGSEHDDILKGDDKNNRLFGFGGNDELTGRGGDDWLDGGRGDDMLDGGEGWDQLYGGPGDDTLNGGPGHYDVLAGGPGADTMDGGAGIFDTASYTASNAGVTIDLSVTDNGYSTGSGGDAEGDKLKNIEYIWGSPYNDTLTGDDKSNYLWGGAGDDTLSGGPQADILVGGPGADTLDGGTDNSADVAEYYRSNAGVTINLGAIPDSEGYITGTGGHAQGDKLKNIEQIQGSGHADTLTGDNGPNELRGNAGNDILRGGGDMDSLHGGPGDDTLTGGDGEDEFVFEPGGGSDTITDFDPAEEEIVLFNFGLSFGDLIITTPAGTSDTLIEVGDVSITLENFTGTLVAGDFFFDG